MKHAPITQSPKSPVVQRKEARSIAIHDEPHSLPLEPIDRSVYTKIGNEKAELFTLSTEYKHTQAYADLNLKRYEHQVNRDKQRSLGGLVKTSIRSYTKSLKRLNSAKNFFDTLAIN